MDSRNSSDGGGGGFAGEKSSSDNLIYASWRSMFSSRFCSSALFLTVLCAAIWSFLLGYLAGPHIDFSSSSSSSGIISSKGTSSGRSGSGSGGGGGGGGGSYTFATPIISLYNEYTVNRPLTGDYPWDNIVEPFRITTMEVTNAVTLDGYYYEWYVDGWHKEDGSSIPMIFTAPTGVEQAVTVQLKRSSDKQVMVEGEIKVMCKYVRREIRSLVDQDREAFFQAVAIMQRVPTQVRGEVGVWVAHCTHTHIHTHSHTFTHIYTHARTHITYRTSQTYTKHSQQTLTHTLTHTTKH
jgi:hypothetical protein